MCWREREWTPWRSVRWDDFCTWEILTPGGIHLPNLPQLLHASISPEKDNHLAGIAVISDIVGSTDPRGAAQELKVVLDSFYRGRGTKVAGLFRTKEGLSEKELLDGVGSLMQVTRKETPLVNQVRLGWLDADSLTADHQQCSHQRLSQCHASCRRVAHHGHAPERC